VKMDKKIKNLAGEGICKKEFWIRVFISILVLEQKRIRSPKVCNILFEIPNYVGIIFFRQGKSSDE